MKAFDLDSYLKDLAYVVNIDSGHHFSEGTNAVAQFFKEKYDALGFKTGIKYYQGEKSAPFLTVRNSDDEHIDLLMVGHMDTVFAPGTAKDRPFSIDEAGHGRGPGCIDCKGGCVLMYYILKAMKEAGEINFSFCVAMNSDEETKSTYSRAYFEELAEKADNCFVFEPGRANYEFVRQRKGGNNYLVKCHGIPAHSGVCPEKGASAIVELAKWVQVLQEKYFLLDEGTTINIGRFEGGADNGSVPDYAEFTISMRVMTNGRMDEIDRELMAIPEHPFDPRCRVEVDRVSTRPAMTPDDKTYAIIKVLEDTAKKLGLHSVDTLVTGGGSDGNFVAQHNCATIDGCGPCGSSLHTADEYLIIESIEDRFTLMRETIKRLFA